MKLSGRFHPLVHLLQLGRSLEIAAGGTKRLDSFVHHLLHNLTRRLTGRVDQTRDLTHWPRSTNNMLDEVPFFFFFKARKPRMKLKEPSTFMVMSAGAGSELTSGSIDPRSPP